MAANQTEEKRREDASTAARFLAGASEGQRQESLVSGQQTDELVSRGREEIIGSALTMRYEVLGVYTLEICISGTQARSLYWKHREC